MPVYLPSAVVGNDDTLVTLGQSGEIMGWFYPAKDHAQNIHQCLPCVYFGEPGHGMLSWTWGGEWQREQRYEHDANICITILTTHPTAAPGAGLQLVITDVVPPDETMLLRHIEVRNLSAGHLKAGIFHYGNFNLGGVRQGNGVRYDFTQGCLLQTHREVALAIGGDALETWQCGKAAEGWPSNSKADLADGQLYKQDLEIGDVDWAFGFQVALEAGDSVDRTAIFALAPDTATAVHTLNRANQASIEEYLRTQREHDAGVLKAGELALQEALPTGVTLPENLMTAYRRSLLCLPLLTGREGVAVAAPEFDPDFQACGGYGYHWPRDGAEYISGLLDAGYPEFAESFFDWCARHQDPAGLWHQRYFLNGAPGPNWCLPPDMLQVDQVGAVLWAYGKWRKYRRHHHEVPSEPIPGDVESLEFLKAQAHQSTAQTAKIEQAALERLRAVGQLSAHENHKVMIRCAADYLVSRLTPQGVHANAFDTWETFVGSFTYSNAAIYAALQVAGHELQEERYLEAAKRVKAGVLQHFVRTEGDWPYLVRGFDAHGQPDSAVDSASLGAIEPFGLLDLQHDDDLRLAEGTLHIIRERLEVDWEGGRAIRRFEGDAYVGGVPACVNTLWMARCSLLVGVRLRELGRTTDANELRDRAQLYLSTVLHRATPTGLLPELMQGPEGQRYWAAPHGWAMASFVSGVLMLARQL